MYSSLHHYLDLHLGTNPSTEDIIHAKAEYWKGYRKEHRKNRVARAKALHLTISKSLWKELKSRSEKVGMNVYDFIKRNLKSGLDSKIGLDTQVTIEIMQCFELLRDCADGVVSLEHVLAKMESLILKL